LWKVLGAEGIDEKVIVTTVKTTSFEYIVWKILAIYAREKVQIYTQI